MQSQSEAHSEIQSQVQSNELAKHKCNPMSSQTLCTESNPITIQLSISRRTKTMFPSIWSASSEAMPPDGNPHASLAVFNPTENRLQSRCFSQCFKQSKIARRPPCRHMQLAVAFAFKSNAKTDMQHSTRHVCPMHVQCHGKTDSNAIETLMQQNSQFTHPSFSLLSLFFLLRLKLPKALAQFLPKRSRSSGSSNGT